MHVGCDGNNGAVAVVRARAAELSADVYRGLWFLSIYHREVITAFHHVRIEDRSLYPPRTWNLQAFVNRNQYEIDAVEWIETHVIDTCLNFAINARSEKRHFIHIFSGNDMPTTTEKEVVSY